MRRESGLHPFLRLSDVLALASLSESASFSERGSREPRLLVSPDAAGSEFGWMPAASQVRSLGPGPRCQVEAGAASRVCFFFCLFIFSLDSTCT